MPPHWFPSGRAEMGVLPSQKDGLLRRSTGTKTLHALPAFPTVERGPSCSAEIPERSRFWLACGRGAGVEILSARRTDRFDIAPSAPVAGTRLERSLKEVEVIERAVERASKRDRQVV